MDIETPRRRFLEAAGATAAISVAGCNALQDQTGTEGGGSGGERTVTVALQPDQQALAEAQREIQQRVQNGDISRREAQREIQQTQQDLLANASDAFEGNVSGTDAIAVDDSVTELGVVLVTGEAGAIIDTLAIDAVAALLPSSSFEQARAQAGGGSATTESG